MKKLVVFMVLFQFIFASYVMAYEERFIPSDLVIKDRKAYRIWTRDASIIGNAMTWNDAFKAVKDLNEQKYAGLQCWRLPEKEELLALSNYTMQGAPSAGDIERKRFSFKDVGLLKNVQLNLYWSATHRSFDNVWVVDMFSGSISEASKTGLRYVWPVCNYDKKEMEADEKQIAEEMRRKEQVEAEETRRKEQIEAEETRRKEQIEAEERERVKLEIIAKQRAKLEIIAKQRKKDSHIKRIGTTVPTMDLAIKRQDECEAEERETYNTNGVNPVVVFCSKVNMAWEYSDKGPMRRMIVRQLRFVLEGDIDQKNHLVWKVLQMQSLGVIDFIDATGGRSSLAVEVIQDLVVSQIPVRGSSPLLQDIARTEKIVTQIQLTSAFGYVHDEYLKKAVANFFDTFRPQFLTGQYKGVRKVKFDSKQYKWVYVDQEEAPASEVSSETSESAGETSKQQAQARKKRISKKAYNGKTDGR